MRWNSRSVGLMTVAATVWTLGVGISATQQHDQHGTGTHQHPAAAKLKNPVKSDTASLATGKKLFTAQCASCHGEAGKGNGKAAATLNPKPPDLTDADWKHGASDGEIFTVIRDGAPKTSMRGYASRMTTQELWSIVNYLRTLRPSSNSQ